ncbi:MAG: Mrp/NBP35 family ATP-binding protein [candidate division NC10 bacterium]|nr:Mrp/NBP35 family ATP-binding protein [candidate division NC10 bacterium]
MPKRYKDIVGDAGSNVVAQLQEHQERLAARLHRISHTVAVMSGKGGVGKTVVTVNLAAVLAREGYAVGVLDADINGPSVAKMMGVRGASFAMGERGVSPARGLLGIKVMSMDLLLPGDAPVMWEASTKQDAFVWRGMAEVNALREFLADTDWGELDFLLIDLPPGTDRFPNLVQLLPPSGALIVTIPSEVSHLVVKRSIAVAKELKAPLIGLVENMAGYVCPTCGSVGALFEGKGAEGMAAELDIPYLGRIPFDPRIATSSDEGRPFFLDCRESPAGRAFACLGEEVRRFVKSKPPAKERVP